MITPYEYYQPYIIFFMFMFAVTVMPCIAIWYSYNKFSLPQQSSCAGSHTNCNCDACSKPPKDCGHKPDLCDTVQHD